jgi:hypothetical protein
MASVAIVIFVQLLLAGLVFLFLYFTLTRRQQLHFAKVKRSERSYRRVMCMQVRAIELRMLESIAQFQTSNEAIAVDMEAVRELAEEMSKRADRALNMANVMAGKFDNGFTPERTGPITLGALRKKAEDRVASELAKKQGEPIVRGHETEKAAA